MPYLAPDVWTLDADFWLARLRRQPPADGAKARLTDALVAVENASAGTPEAALPAVH